MTLKIKLSGWKQELPAKTNEITKLIKQVKNNLPKEYIELLKFSNGGEGELQIEPGWFQLWKANEVINKNKVYEIDKYLPGYFGFGSSGGGELLAIKTTSSGKQKSVVMVPFIPMEEKEAIVIADSFAQFIASIGK
jgi:hypothetical protein